MNTTVSKTLVAGALAGAALLGFWSGQKHTAPTPVAVLNAVEPADTLEQETHAPATSAPETVLEASPEAAPPSVDPASVQADPASREAPSVQVESVDPDAMPKEAEALVQAHQQFRD